MITDSRPVLKQIMLMGGECGPSKRLLSAVIGKELLGVRKDRPEGLTVICQCMCGACLLVLSRPWIGYEEKEGGT